MLPLSPLKFRSIPLFHVDFFPSDFSGKLYFILGQGLGDHVNGFRIIIEIQKKFPNAHCIVYADLRWMDLVVRLKNIEIRWYPKAKDIRSQDGTTNPYDTARIEVRKEISLSYGAAFLAYDHFPMPDRHARHESTLESIARSIGLVLGNDVRPYVPLLPSDLDWTESFLAKNELKKEKYVVISPLSLPNKTWEKDNFSSLIDLIYQNFGFRTIIASYPEVGLFNNEGTICAYNLSLGQLAGVLSSSALYIGLDSGPSHMCAFFDVPMLVIYLEKKFIPFEVRPLSPYALLIVESLFSSSMSPSVETVFKALSFLLKVKPFNEKKFNCLACGRRMDHIISSHNDLVRQMCSCGLALDRRINNVISPGCDALESGITTNRVNEEVMRAGSVLSDNEVVRNEKRLSQVSEISVRLSTQTIALESINLCAGKIIWSLDSLLYWMGNRGFLPISLTHYKDAVLITFSASSAARNSNIAFPWGNKSIKMTVERYLNYYMFAKWATPQILVGIVKAMSEIGLSRKERFYCAIVALRVDLSFRSLRWLFKALL